MAYRIKVLDQFIHAINSHKVISDILGIQISSSIYNPLLYVQIAATFLAPEEKNCLNTIQHRNTNAIRRNKGLDGKWVDEEDKVSELFHHVLIPRINESLAMVDKLILQRDECCSYGYCP
ncbi:hypothetical protein GOBAR_DD23268 [Gossypium barbadense]|nr:hypothetical protein GOBAR_DD23268 [Gossypium barbadense]